jgi:hypothetical protein
MPELDLTTLATERARLRATYLRTGAARTPTTARGVHHVALLCRNVERTIQFRSYWIPGSYETSSSMSAPSNALPRFRTL